MVRDLYIEIVVRILDVVDKIRWEWNFESMFWGIGWVLRFIYKFLIKDGWIVVIFYLVNGVYFC